MQQNSSVLSNRSEEIFVKDVPVIIDICDVSMDYNFANEKLTSLKEYFIALLKRQLMFKRFRALEDISFKVQKGDVFGILGTNGSGKSTLLKIVSGVLEPTEGSVEIVGNIAPLIEMGAGFDFELTGRENVYLNGALLGYPKHFIDQHFDEIVEFSEIGQFIDLPLKNYSSGMVSRIAFAIATIMVPDILIVDEVLSVGDQMFRKKCEKRIQELIKDHGTTVLMVSHSSDEIDRMCNKAIWIEKGHMRMIGEAKDVSLAYQALGGHSGSEEAEDYIFQILKRSPRKDANFVSFISGHKDALVDDIINNFLLTYDKSIDTVVIIDSNDPSMYQLGSSFAAWRNGALVLLDAGEIDSNTASFLTAVKPSNVFYLGNISKRAAIEREVSAFCGNPEFVAFEGNGVSSLSFELFDYLALSDEKPSSIVISAGNAGAASAALSAYAYSNKLALLIAETESEFRRALDIADSGQFEDVIVLDGDVEGNIFSSSDLLGSNRECIILRDDCTLEAAQEAVEWVLDREEESFKTLFVTDIETPTYAFLSASLASRNKALPLPVNHANLDSMKSACEVTERMKDRIEYIRLIGSEGAFDDVDMKLFACAASKG